LLSSRIISRLDCSELSQTFNFIQIRISIYLVIWNKIKNKKLYFYRTRNSECVCVGRLAQNNIRSVKPVRRLFFERPISQAYLVNFRLENGHRLLVALELFWLRASSHICRCLLWLVVLAFPVQGVVVRIAANLQVVLAKPRSPSTFVRFVRHGIWRRIRGDLLITCFRVVFKWLSSFRIIVFVFVVERKQRDDLRGRMSLTALGSFVVSIRMLSERFVVHVRFGQLIDSVRKRAIYTKVGLDFAIKHVDL